MCAYGTLQKVHVTREKTLKFEIEVKVWNRSPQN